MSIVVEIRGGDFTLQFTIKDKDGAPVDLSGRTPLILDASPGFAGTLTAAMIDAGAGRYDVTRVGPPLPTGLYRFRVRLTGQDLQAIGTPEITARVV
jgi:hypothetical protein